MAFKRSGVRLPLAPPKNEVVSISYDTVFFELVYRKKVIESHKGAYEL
jgi:hypothetical protein